MAYYAQSLFADGFRYRRYSWTLYRFPKIDNALFGIGPDETPEGFVIKAKEIQSAENRWLNISIFLRLIGVFLLFIGIWFAASAIMDGVVSSAWDADSWVDWLLKRLKLIELFAEENRSSMVVAT
jgi:hypothetical protein